MKIRLAVITATRAEYGVLRPLIVELLQDDCFECNLIVTGTHLLEKYGKTEQFIEKDQIPIQYRIPIIDDGNEEQCNIIGCAIAKFSTLYQKEKYDAIVVLGDRYELYGFCIPAMLYRIPIIHIHGGEKTEGAVDEKIRHSITKMASVHFPSVESYAKRIIQMGENPKYVYPVGALGIDNIVNLPLLEKKDLEENLGIDFSKNVAIVTFHPVTMDSVEETVKQAEIVFDTLINLPLFLLVTMPNSDMGGEYITEYIIRLQKDNPGKVLFRKSLGQINYLSSLRYAKLVIGNSSSGIIETSSFGIPTINIGERQKGRLAPKNVIHCECCEEDIETAVFRALSDEFKESLNGYKNPYGDGKTANRIKNILKKINWKDSKILKKEFFDIDFDTNNL